MNQVILSQANRIAQGDQDVAQNILAWNCQNFKSASLKGKILSIGEQVNFMKHRAGEFKSGIRRDFGHNGYRAHLDMYNKKLYYTGEVELLRLQYEDDADHEERPNDGKGDITAFTSIKNVEAGCLFQVDLEMFLERLTDVEKTVLIKRLEGFTIMEIAGVVKLNSSSVRGKLQYIGKRYVDWFNIDGAERFGLG